MSEYTDKIMKIFLNNKEHGKEGAKMVEIEIFSARNTTGIAINNMRVTKTKPYGFIQPMQKYVVDEKAIIEAIGADVQPDFKELCEQMEALQDVWDIEEAHGKADDILCEALRQLGYNELVDLYEKIDKWYS